MPSPHFSLILPTFNGMPNLRRAIAAVERQTYRDFDVIVQDGGSTDGTLEYLHGIDQPNLHVASAPDDGIGDACNRAMQRAGGPLVVVLAPDEWLEDNALERFVAWYGEHPDAAFVYGGTRFWKSPSEMHSEVHAGSFDLFRFLMSEIAPTACGYYNKAIIGADFYLRQDRKTCSDFDLFIRLGLRFGTPGIINKWEILLNALVDESGRASSPEISIQMGRDRHAILERHFTQQGDSQFLARMRCACISSMYCHLAGKLFSLAGDSLHVRRFLLTAHHYDPGSVKLAGLLASLRQSGLDFSLPGRPPEELPEHQFNGLIDIARAHSKPAWAATGARTTCRGDRVEITTGWAMRSPAAEIPFDFRHCDPAAAADGQALFRLDMLVSVKSGQIGIGILTADGRLRHEQSLFESDNQPISLTFRRDDQAVLVRNLGEGISAVELADLQAFRPAAQAGRDETWSVAE